MGTEEKNILRAITEAVSLLPDEARTYIMGYAEGVLAVAGSRRTDAAQDGA